MALVDIFKRRKRRFYKSLLLGLCVSLVVSAASWLGYFEALEAKALDLLLWARGQVKSPEIVLVQIDDQAFHNLQEKQPLPRSYLAGLIELLARSGAKVIGMDIELKVPTDAREDDRLLQAVEATVEDGISKVVPVFVIRPEKEEAGNVVYQRSPFFSPKLMTVAGFANAPVDPDGFVRQLPLAVRGSDGKILPSLALAVLARYAGYDDARLNEALNRNGKITLLLPEWDRFQGKLLPKPTPFSFEVDDAWKINFAGAQGSFKAIPSDPVFQLSRQAQALAGDNPFRGKIVLIGATFGDSRDFFPTSQGLMSGVEIHANIVHTLLSRTQIRPAHRWVALAILVVFAVFTSFLVTLLRPTLVTVVSLAAIPLVLIPLSYLSFAYLGLWVDFVTPLLAIRWGTTLGDYLESRHIRRSLEEYVDREVADQIVYQEEGLGGKRKQVSVFFTDVRNYTTLCESLPPERVVGILNELFGMMGKIIARHNGFIVDFVGDAVLAVFGAARENPNHARDAVQTAVEVQSELVDLNARWEKRGIPPLKIGVGVHTGEAQVGVVGGQRKKFGVTGDTVNTGARVEALNKEFATSILITRETLDQLDGGFEVAGRGEVKVKGRDKSVELFEVLCSGSSEEKGIV
jgi:adenylate cyclase